MVKLHEMRHDIREAKSWWYYLETEKSVVFLRMTSDTNIHIYLSNKERLERALRCSPRPRHRVINISDEALKDLVDKFSAYPELPAIFGTISGNPHETTLIKRMRNRIEDLSFAEIIHASRERH